MLISHRIFDFNCLVHWCCLGDGRPKALYAETRLVRESIHEMQGLPCFRLTARYRNCTMTISSRSRRIDGAEDERCPQASLSEPDSRLAAGHTAEIHKDLSDGQMHMGFTGSPGYRYSIGGENMAKKNFKNIVHITMNTKETVVLPIDSVKLDWMKFDIERMVGQAMTSGMVSVVDDEDACIKAKCDLNLENGTYMATLFLKGYPQMPLMVTAGTLTAEVMKKLWSLMKSHWRLGWGYEAPYMKSPRAPYICDVFFNDMFFLGPYIMTWMRDFAKCFGIYMLKMLSQYKEMQKMVSSEAVREGTIMRCSTEHEKSGSMEKQDHVAFNVDHDGIVMKISFNNLTQTEIKEFATGKDLNIGLTDLEGISMFAVKAGNLNWIAVPYIPCLSECVKKFNVWNKDSSIRLKLVLDEGETGKAKWVRSIRLTKKWHEDLNTALVKQEDRVMDRNEYDRAVERIYSNYSIQHVVERLESVKSEE